MGHRGENQIARPVLTLHNLYRMLTQPDYPTYAYRVFPGADLRGTSLVLFWEKYFNAIFSEKIDLSVFHQDKGQNRTLSRLLNRSGSPRLMEKWFQNLSAQLDEKMVLRAIESWMTTLEEKHYVPQALDDRLQVFLQKISESDEWDLLDGFPAILPETLPALKRNTQSVPPLLFSHGFFLTWLTFYALFLGRTSMTALNRLQITHDLSCLALYQQYLKSKGTPEPRVITTRQCTLCASPLSEDAYFGNWDHLQQAAKMVISHHKVAITGIGGCGKTEFVRQILPLLLQKGVYTQIAYLQYQYDLESTVAAAFSNLRDAEPGDRMRLARSMMEEMGERTLLLIDNVDQMPNKDPTLSDLMNYGCDIVLTSRFPEPAGFIAFPLSGLDPKNACQLFWYHCPHRGFTQDDVLLFCDSVGYHPLAITLFARLCRIRFWSMEKLRERLAERGLKTLSFVHQAQSVHLAEVFTNLFNISRLESGQKKLMQLFSLLPYRYWLPLDLLPFAVDLLVEEDTLSDQCQILCDMGWLLVNENGYALHPLIAETVLLQPIDAEEFPRLWDYLGGAISAGDNTACEALICLLPRLRNLNSAAIRCLTLLEHEIGIISYLPIPASIYDLHQRYLQDHSEEIGEIEDFWLSLGIRDIVHRSNRNNLGEYFQQIMALDSDLSHVRRRETLLTLLEYACAESKLLPQIQQMFELLHSSKERSLEVADYLISYSVLQRRGYHDPQHALASLSEAEQILSQNQQQTSLRFSNLQYRRGICLLDLDQPQKAKEALAVSLQLLLDLGYPVDSAKVMSTRSTYAVALNFCCEREAAMEEYQQLAAIYQTQGRIESAEYAMMLNNTALLLDQTGRYADAEQLEIEVLRIDQKLALPADIPATHQRNAALFLVHQGKYTEARHHAEAAWNARKKFFGPDSPWTADAAAVLGFIDVQDAQRNLGLDMLEKACVTLEQSWGGEHRHTVTALQLLEKVRQETDASKLFREKMHTRNSSLLKNGQPILL